MTFSKNYYEEDYIKYISCNLPIGFKLLVKEHHEMIGDRNISFYERIKALGNIELLQPSTSPEEILSLVNGVIGISGTSILEAIIKRIPSTAIGMPEFRELIPRKYLGIPGIEKFLDDISKNDIENISESKLDNYIQNIISWDIKWTHKEWNDFILNRKNIELDSEVFKSIIKIIDSLSKK